MKNILLYKLDQIVKNQETIVIKWTGFTKDNPLKSGIRYANALLSGIIFIVEMCGLQ